jgi:hypothetical protein
MKMQRFLTINRAAVGVALGLLAGLAARTLGDDFRIGIQIGSAPPPPPQPVVVEYQTYYVGPRAALYDADLHLRSAQAHQWRAAETLDVAVHREGELAVMVDEQEALVAKYANQAAGGEQAIAAAKARVGAFQKRLQGAHDDLEAARTLNDSAGVADAQARIATNEAAVAKATDELHAAEQYTLIKEQLAAAQASLPEHRVQLVTAQDEVFASRQRLEAANLDVAEAMHERDEAMWVLYRDEIMAGRGEAVGFHADLALWGGRMPRDPEVVHAYFVRPSGYWVERPGEVQMRIVEVDRNPEIVRVREVQHSHETTRLEEIETAERSVPVERRQAYAERVVVARQRLGADQNERAVAAKEGRPPRISPEERAQAKATVIEARANAKATEIQAHADAKAKDTEAHADAKSKVTEAHADAKSKVVDAHADAKTKEIQAKSDSRNGKTNVADSNSRSGRDSSSSARGSDNKKDKKKDGIASTDPNR